METRRSALTTLVLMLTLAACPALEPSAAQTSRVQAAGSGAIGGAAPTSGPAISPQAPASPDGIAEITEEADAGLAPPFMPSETDAGLTPPFMPSETDAGVEPGLMPDDADAGGDLPGQILTRGCQ